MSFINIEIKAKCIHPKKVNAFLLAHNAEFIGTDHQIDTYFNVPEGRLKLREGNIEKALIFYNRPDRKGPKQSDFNLAPVNDSVLLKSVLTAALGIKVIVDKKREIYYIKNVKFHIDEVQGLGNFMEIEAGNKTDISKTKEALQKQCDYYIEALEIKEEDFIEVSYSDLLLQRSF
ncbi:MAG: hypothetical protein JWN76_1028 [Chitinophagaceae bacterium]|nr:hypothetical protein [Chitinophagaceae bacterium]